MTYAGDVTPAEAWQALIDDPRAVLVDVRTRPEWIYVGLPDLRPAGKEVVQIEWQTFPTGSVNGAFLDELERAGVERDQTIFFICRSGVRSIAAAEAATRAGWHTSLNVLEGFEGPPGPDDRRTVSGWKVAGLPWVQA
jgi:rhodanese-related sulfurtransferase